MKLGIILDNLGLPLNDAIAAAGRLGVRGVQVYAVDGVFSPAHMTRDKFEDILSRMADNGLEFSALCADFGGHGFQDAQANPKRIERTKEILHLAKLLGTDIVTTHIGIIPENNADGVYDVMYEACRALEATAVSMDGYIAIETGCETARRLGDFLGNFTSGRLCVNYDPANLVMVTGDDPVVGVETLSKYIVHTHVKDGIRYKPVDPRVVYGYPGFKPMNHKDIAEMVTHGAFFREVAVGNGQVDFPKYINQLKSVGYDGYLTIEREFTAEAGDEAAKTVAFLKNLLA